MTEGQTYKMSYGVAPLQKFTRLIAFLIVETHIKFHTLYTDLTLIKNTPMQCIVVFYFSYK